MSVYISTRDVVQLINWMKRFNYKQAESNTALSYKLGCCFKLMFDQAERKDSILKDLHQLLSQEKCLYSKQKHYHKTQIEYDYKASLDALKKRLRQPQNMQQPKIREDQNELLDLLSQIIIQKMTPQAVQHITQYVKQNTTLSKPEKEILEELIRAQKSLFLLQHSSKDKQVSTIYELKRYLDTLANTQSTQWMITQEYAKLNEQERRLLSPIQNRIINFRKAFYGFSQVIMTEKHKITAVREFKDTKQIYEGKQLAIDTLVQQGHRRNKQLELLKEIIASMSGWLLKNDRKKDYQYFIRNTNEKLGKLIKDHTVEEQIQTIINALSRIPELNCSKEPVPSKRQMVMYPKREKITEDQNRTLEFQKARKMKDQQLSIVASEKQKLTQDNLLLKIKIDSLNTQLYKARQSVQKLEKQVQVVRSKNDSLNSKKMSSIGHQKVQHKKNSSDNQTLDSMKTQIFSLQTELERIQNTNRTLENENSKLKEQICRQRIKERAFQKGLKEENVIVALRLNQQNLNSSLESLSRMNQKFKIQIQQLKSQLVQLRQRSQILDATMAKCAKLEDKLRNEKQHLQSCRNSYKQLKQQYSRQQNQIKDLETANQDLKKKLKQATNVQELKSLRQKVLSYESQCKRADAQIVQKDKDNATLKINLTSLKQEYEHLASNSEINSLKHQIKQLKDRQSRTREELSSLRIQLQRKEQELTQIRIDRMSLPQ